MKKTKNDQMKMFRVWAQRIQEWTTEVRAKTEEEAIEKAQELDEGEWICEDDDVCGWQKLHAKSI